MNKDSENVVWFFWGSITLLSSPFGTTFEWENKNSINGKYYFFTDCIISWKENKKVKIQVGIDITSLKKSEEKILKLVNYDILTGLPNRVLFKEYLQRAIIASRRSSNYNAILFIDLDNFKIVNDTAGHNVGDMLLIEVSKRIRKIIRKNDMLARLGGDEFIILIDTFKNDKKIALDNIGIVTQKLLKIVAKPYNIMNHDLHISVSIGIKIFNNDVESIDELIKHADNAMYDAKAKGRNTFCFFNQKLQRAMEDKIKLIDDLRKAIENNHLSLYYQVQISSNSNKKTTGVEALIRWNHPTDGLVSPAKFIPAAEESGLIVPLGKWILDEAIRQLKIWKNDTTKNHWRVSVNVSSKQFEEDNFISIVEAILSKYNVKASMIRLELTEGLLIQNVNQVIGKLHKLKEMGLSISIDDFGTGYSSLSYLKQLPIDELKIDQSFIKDLTTDINDEIITQTIISIGQKFGLEVIAEGVETKEQYEKLRSMGCQYFQGYLFAKPVSVEYL